jgi:hypothetical protein
MHNIPNFDQKTNEVGIMNRMLDHCPFPTSLMLLLPLAYTRYIPFRNK